MLILNKSIIFAYYNDLVWINKKDEKRLINFSRFLFIKKVSKWKYSENIFLEVMQLNG